MNTREETKIVFEEFQNGILSRYDKHQRFHLLNLKSD